MATPATLPAQFHPQARQPGRGDLYRILDAGYLAHVGYVRGRMPVVVPTPYVRDGHSILLPGRPGSVLRRAAAAGAALSATVTLLDDARTYRSVLIFGRASPVEADRAGDALRVLAARIVPAPAAIAEVLRLSLNMSSVRLSDH
jgi:nitroimidazol reductase NimA-like FMN-containing flavoprotein (pyridoxamine 5'-phosphate oxidase superfamily)